jgi:hypothetical protein
MDLPSKIHWLVLLLTTLAVPLNSATALPSKVILAEDFTATW